MAAPPIFPPDLSRRIPCVAVPWYPDNPNPRTPSRGSPEDLLLRAAFDGNLRLVRKMARELGGDEGRCAEKVRAVRDSNGLGAVHVAAARGKLPVCRYLVEELASGCQFNQRGGMSMTPLIYAIDAGSVDVVRYLLDNGSDTETLMSTGLKPLVYAVGKGNCEIVQALLSKGACIDALTTVGAALHFAAHDGRDDMVKILLDHHADPNKVAYGANRPLIYAIYARSLKCVKLLIEAGADVRGVGTETPLALAATDGLTDILKCLVQAGADPNVCDGFGFTPLENAARYSRREDVEILFPVTSRIPNVRDWSVDGIISYAKSKPAPKEEDFCRDYLCAEEIYTKAMNLDPDDATLFSNRSLCWLRLGDGKKALTDAVASKSMRPGWSKFCYREGAARMLLKDYEKACGAFLDGLKLEPDNAEIESALWEALESLKISRNNEKE
ncbi:unnamed protein product [Urochloa decumbens]|uniref:Uncharacterized protein n=1 Tax=Urochloa decumbens TaxID=240449 RepID=A0ABC8ZZX5_9POAL